MVAGKWYLDFSTMGKLRCPICRTSQWRKEPSSGMLICSEGHILQGYRKESHEQTETSQHVMKKRTIKSTRKDSKTERPSNLAYYHGLRARYLYLQCLQLLFRLQVAALQVLWSLPKEFEAISRDVWSLHMTLLPQPIEIDLEEEAQTVRSPQVKEQIALTMPGEDSDSSTPPPHSSDDEMDEMDTEPESDLAKLLDGVSEGSSEDEAEHVERDVVQRQKHVTRRECASPVANIAVLMVACWMLRLPVTYMDFARLIRDYRLPYLDPIQRGLIPGSMVAHMKKGVMTSLSPLQPPRPLQMHRTTSRLSYLIATKYQIIIPEVNAPHIISRVLKALHVPPVFYRLVKDLASKLSISLTLHPSLAPLDAPTKKRKILLGDNIPTEMAFACVVTLLLKLIYGLDGQPRTNLTEEDIRLKLPQKDEILSRLRKDQVSASAASSQTVLDYLEKDLDDYLAFAECALLGGTPSSFSLSTVNSAPSDEFEDSPSPSGSLEFPSASQLLSRGKNHTVYTTNDVLGLLPEEYQLVVSQAARWCGVEDGDIATIVERYEKRLLRETERKIKQSSESRERAGIDEDYD